MDREDKPLGRVADSDGRYCGQIVYREVLGQYYSKFVPPKGSPKRFPVLGDYNIMVRQIRAWVQAESLHWLTEVPRDFDSDILRSAFDRSGLTQKQLAEAVGITQPSVSALLRGTATLRKNRLHVIERICDCLGLMPSDLGQSLEAASRL